MTLTLVDLLNKFLVIDRRFKNKIDYKTQPQSKIRQNYGRFLEKQTLTLNIEQTKL